MLLMKRYLPGFSSCIIKKAIVLVSFAMITAFQLSAQDQQAHLVTKNITYKTNKAGEVYIIWAVNFWQTPENSYWPMHTFLKDKYACTKMVKNGNSFETVISLPVNTRLDYYFWIPTDQNGKEVQGWDTNFGHTYTSVFLNEETVSITDGGFQIIKDSDFLVKRSKLILGASFLVLLILLAFSRKQIRFRPFLISLGIFISATLFIFLARLQIISPEYEFSKLALGGFFPDLLWQSLIGMAFFLLFYLLPKSKTFTIVLFTIFFIVCLLSVLISLLNIEVVKQLGTPFTYKWLYYSDFLKGNDARAGAAATLSFYFILHIAALLASFVCVGLILFILLIYFSRIKKWQYAILALYSVLLITSFYLSNRYFIKKAKVENPVVAFVLSLSGSRGKETLLKENIPDSISQYMSALNSQTYASRIKGAELIDNVIVFVSESTPFNYISVYDSSYNCTPYLKSWQRIGSVYQNMYAHIPSTPNSFLSLISGIYPLLDFKSALLENIHLPQPSLPELLHEQGWKTSVVFASDLSYSRMKEYAKKQNFSSIEDCTSINCPGYFSVSKSTGKVLDDSCIVRTYLNWMDENSGNKTFTVLWTNQTHAPYYAKASFEYSKDKVYLNTYLNALHHTDSVFNTLMTELEKRNKLKNTLVVFIADHGEAFDTHDQKLHASKVYEENVHIPCILFNPVLFNGAHKVQIAGITDIPPTITHLLGIPKPKPWEGNSLLADSLSDRTFFVSPYTDLIIGTRHNNWKYIYNADTEDEELYDLSKDPNELHNIVSEQTVIAAHEHEVLAAWFQYVNGKYSQWKSLSK